MAFVDGKTLVNRASDNDTSIIAFNCVDYNMIYAVAKGAEKANKPVMVMLYPEHHTLNNWINPETFYAAVKSVAEEVNIDMALHLDHCQSFDYIKRALDAGFKSVMYDGSMLPFEENIANTKKVAEMAHAVGATVEAELGHVGMAVTESDQTNLDLYTKPDVAAEFIERSTCDSLAVAIGSAHGVYKQTPHLDLKRLTEINAATPAPLVLHGGSGIPHDQLVEAFKLGINKFNVGTEFFQLYYDSWRDYTAAHDANGGNLYNFPAYSQPILADYIAGKIQLCTL